MEGALRFVAGRPSHNVLLSRLVACYMGGMQPTSYMLYIKEVMFMGD